MKTAKFAAIGAASIFAVVALLLAIPAVAAMQTNTALITSANPSSTSTSVVPAPAALTVGQTITLTSTSGTWKLISTPAATGSATTGPAAGTMTLTVTGVFKAGYTLSLTSGSLTLSTATPATSGTTSTPISTTYAFGTGSAVMGPHQAHLVGQGTLASATPGSFLFAAGAHANFQGKTFSTLRFDLKVNGQEYGVLLLVTAQVS
jgi:hypothetical protein